MIPPLFLRPPVDSNPSALLPRLKGCRCTGHKRGKGGRGEGWGWRRGWEREWSVSEIREEETQLTHPTPPHRGLTSTPTHPNPHLCLLHPAPAPAPAPRRPAPFCPTALPHVRRVQTANGAARRCWQASLGVCVQGPGDRRGRAAGRREGPLFFRASGGAVITPRYSCAHWGLPYLTLRWPLNLSSPRCPQPLPSTAVFTSINLYFSPLKSRFNLILSTLLNFVVYIFFYLSISMWSYFLLLNVKGKFCSFFLLTIFIWWL